MSMELTELAQLILQLEPEAQAAVVALVKKLHPSPMTAQQYIDAAAKLMPPAPVATAAPTPPPAS